MKESKTQNFLELLKKIREAYRNLPIVVKAIVHDDADHPVYETHVLMSDSEAYPRHIIPFDLYICPVVSYEMRKIDSFRPVLIDMLGVQPSSDVLAVVTLDATGDVPVRSPRSKNEADAEVKSAYESLGEQEDEESYWQGYTDAAFGLMGLTINDDGTINWARSPIELRALTIEEEDRIRELDLRWDAFRAGMTFAERHGEEE